MHIALPKMLLLLVFALTTLSCATSSGIAGKKRDESKALPLEARADTLFNGRDKKENLERAISLWNESADYWPSARVFTKLARAHFLLGDAIYGLDKSSERRNKNFAQGIQFAEKALCESMPTLRDDLKKGAKFYQLIRLAPKESVAALYWYAANLSIWTANQGIATRLRYADDVKAAMTRLKELDENFFYAGSVRLQGIFEALRANVGGGDLNKSEQYFSEAVRRSPNYLANKLIWAEQLCVLQKDKAKYTKLLRQIIAADCSADPLLEPENRLVQQKAQHLLKNLDSVFSG